MSRYHKRIISYDKDTQLYRVSVPDLGIEVYADTEVSGIMEVRKEVNDYVKKHPERPALDPDPFEYMD